MTAVERKSGTPFSVWLPPPNRWDYLEANDRRGKGVRDAVFGLVATSYRWDYLEANDRRGKGVRDAVFALVATSVYQSVG